MEVDPLARPVLAVDFDGVIHEAPPYASNGPIDGDPAVPGAVDWLHTVAQVFRIVFFSTSATSDEARTRIVNWLTDNGFSGVPYTVTNVKPVAVAFLDDRAIRFDGPGTFPSVAAILAAQPWWELKGVAHDASPQVVASAVAAEARSAEPDVTAAVDAVARATGGTLVGEENRLKAPETIAAKVEKNAQDQQASVAASATSLFDALRYAITYSDDEYTTGVEAALSGLAARGHLLRRLRNYWDPAAPQGTTQPVPVYYAVNAVLQTPDGYDYEVQFHTPESWRVNIEENWPLYEQLRGGDVSQALLARMRQNLLAVPIPAGASQIAAPRPVPHPAPLVADALPKADIAEHNAITRKAAARAWDELEPRLATLIEPVLRRAGRQAAHKFTTLSQRSLRAAAYRTADNRRLAAISPADVRALLRSLALTAAGVPGMESNSTMVAVMPTPEQAKALAVGDQDADILHVTLAYLGEVDGPLTQITDALAPVAASFAPLTGKVAGSGQFGDTVELLLPDVPGLVELRVAVTEALANADVDYGREHGYQPHITVGYLPGEIPDKAHYRLSTLGGEEACSTCSYFQARGWCQMFGAKAAGDMVCDDWTSAPPPAIPAGAPLDFMELLIVRGNNDYVRLPLVGSPPLTAAATGERGLQSSEAQASAQALLADETILESRVNRALQAAKSAQTVTALRSALDDLEVRKRMLIDAQHSGDPERIHIAERNLELTQIQVRHLLDEATASGKIPPVLPPGPAGPEQPIVPAAPPTQVQPAGPSKPLPKAELPKAPEVGHEIQKDQAKDLFAPAESSGTTRDSVKLAGQNLTTLLEDEAFLAQPAEQAIEAVEQTPPEWTKPAGSEVLNTDELAAQVRGVTDPVRQAVIQSVATPVLENVGIGWDHANPYASQVLAQSASQVTAITETTQADVMDAINEAYQQGLSIPDTAKLIRAKMTDASPARARLIARTELAGAVNGGSLAATQIVSQATGAAYQKSWMTAPGAPHPRHENYDGLDGQAADLDGLFQVGDAMLKFPGDPDGPPGEVCNCFPGETLVVAPGAEMGFRRRYEGNLVRLETVGRHHLAGTPNHPVLTSAGWKALGDIREGDYLVCGGWREDEARVHPDVDHVPSPIQEVFGALARAGRTGRIAGSPVQFHGDGTDGEVDVVAPDRQLRHDGTAALLDPATESGFVGGGESSGTLAPGGLPFDLNIRDRGAAAGGIRRLREPLAFVFGSGRHPRAHRGGTPARLDAEFEQAEPDGGTADAVALGERLLGGAFAVTLSEVVEVDVVSFHGDVFNLQTATGAYLAGGIISHNCRCSLSYQEGSGTAQAPDVALPDQVQPTADASVIPAGTLQTSDPAEAAQALAAGQDVMLNQPDEIATFLEDLGKEAAQAQAAGQAALNLDLGKVSVKGTNLFTQDSLGIPRIDMPQLSGTPLPGSLASKLPGGYEGQADQVDIGPLFYQHLREQGVSVTEEDALASHLRSTQKDINGSKVAGLMDRLEAGTAQERRIPVSADGYIVDGHHEWAATIGLDYKTGTDAGLTLPVFRINQPITKILAEANAFDDHYGIPRVSAFVPKVKDAGTARVLARSEPPVATVKDPILGITPFRAGEDNALGFYDSAKAQQFEADLKVRAQAEGLTITSSQHVTGVWEGETEPSYAVHMLGSPEKVNAFAEEMRARYNQDSVMVFVPKKDLPVGMTPNAIEFRLPISDAKAATAKMQAAGVQGATIRGHTLTSIVTADNPDGVAQIGKLADSLGLDRNLIRHRDGHVEFVSRPEETPALTEPTGGPVQPFKAPDPNVELAVGAGMPQYQADYTRAVKPLVEGLPFEVRDWTSKYDVQDVLTSDANARTAKQEVTDGIVARLKDDPAWQNARPQESIAAGDVKVGDYVSEYGSSVIRVDSVAPDTKIDRRMGAYNLREGDVFRLSDPRSVSVLEAFPDHEFTSDTKFETTKYDYDSGDVTAKVVDLGEDHARATGVSVGDVITFPYANAAKGQMTVHVDIIHDKNLIIEGTVVAPSSNGRMGATGYQIYVTDPTRKLQWAQEGNVWQFPQGQGGVTDRSYTALSVSGLVDTWAGTSADSNPWAIAVQKAVNDEFDIREDAFKLIAGRDQNAIDAAEALYAEKGPALRAFVRAQYDNTQLALRTAGLHDVTLYRGMSLGELDNKTLAGIPRGAHIDEVTLQPASSFSADYNTARGFTSDESAIVAARVPADRILSMPRTGNGCLNETEYIVLAPRAGMPTDQAYVYRFDGYGMAPSNAEKFWQAGADEPSAPPAATPTAPLTLGANPGDPVVWKGKPYWVKYVETDAKKAKKFGLGETPGSAGASQITVAGDAIMAAIPAAEFAKVSVDPTTVHVGDLVKIDMSKSKYFQTSLGYEPDSVFQITKVTPGGKAAVELVHPGASDQVAKAGTYLDLMPDEHVFVQVPVGSVAKTPGIPMPDVFGVNGMTHEVKIGDLAPGETFSVTTYTGAHPVYKLDDINEDTGVAHVTVVGADPQLSPGDKTFFGVDVAAKTTPPPTAKSTAWTQGSGTLWNQLDEGDTFVSNGLGGKAAGPVLKYVGKDAAGVPLAEVVDPVASPFKVGAVVPLNKGDTLYHVTGEASEAKPPKSTGWAKGAVVTDPHPGDFVAATEGLFKGAVFSVTGLNKVPGAEVVGTVVDPGKSMLNVGETYMFTKSGLVAAKPWPQQ